MKRVAAVVAVSLAVVFGAFTWVGAQSASPVDGAWVLQDRSFAKPPDNTPTKPMGLLLFAGGHYSLMTVQNSARPNFGQGGQNEATADQLRAVWGPFTANAGRFTVTGNTIHLGPRVVAKNPGAMAADAFNELTFTVNGDNLVLTQVRTQNGPNENPQTFRYTRAR